MKHFFECPECDKTTQVRFSKVDGNLVAVCVCCGKPQPIPVEDAGAPQAQPDEEPETTRLPPKQPVTEDAACPKCGASRAHRQESCPKCGLVFALWVAPAEPFAGHPDLSAMWAALGGVPVADPRHDRFLEACFRAGALSDAARAYKSLSTDGPEDPAARIRQIQLLSQMQFTPSSRVNHHRYRLVLWGLMLLALLAALYIWTITPDDLMR